MFDVVPMRSLEQFGCYNDECVKLRTVENFI